MLVLALVIAIAIHATLHTDQKTLNTAIPQAPAADLDLLLAPQLPLLSLAVWQARNAGPGLAMIPIMTLMAQPEAEMMTMAAIAWMMMTTVTMSISPYLARIMRRATMRMSVRFLHPAHIGACLFIFVFLSLLLAHNPNIRYYNVSRRVQPILSTNKSYNENGAWDIHAPPKPSF